MTRRSVAERLVPNGDPIDAKALRRPSTGPAIIRYFGKLWRGEAPLQRVFWTDMLTVGTLINLVATAAAIVLLVADAPVLAALAVHFLPLPLNMLLLFAVWQSADRSPWGWCMRLTAVAWFAATFVI